MDRVFDNFLAKQIQEWEAFQTQTDRVVVAPVGSGPLPSRYLAEFACKGLVRAETGEIEEADRFAIGIHFGGNHCRCVHPLGLVWVLGPAGVWHPNVKEPVVCIGHVMPGISLIDILYQTYSILTYQNFRVDDCLNEEAASWARNHMDRFPIDPAPLKRRQGSQAAEEVAL